MTWLKDALKILRETPPINSFSTSKQTSPSKYGLLMRLSSCTNRELLQPISQQLGEMLLAMGLQVKVRPVAGKLERWTVLSSPFVHKVARTQLERRTGAWELQVEGLHAEEVKERVIWYLRRIIPANLQLDITLTERHKNS